MKEYGVLSPLMARPVEGGYEIVSGHRRKMTVELLGMEKLPVLVRDMSDDEAIMQNSGYQPVDLRKIAGTSCRSGESRAEPDRVSYPADGQSAGGNRRVQSRSPDGMDGTDEPYPQCGGGNHPGRIDLRIKTPSATVALQTVTFSFI